jgi:hypothetical protein
MRVRGRHGWWWWLCLLFVLGSCGPRVATQLVFRVEADPGDWLSAVTLQVTARTSGRMLLRSAVPMRQPFPLEMGLIAQPGDEREALDVLVEGVRSVSGAVVRQRATVAFFPGRVLLVEFYLARQCNDREQAYCESIGQNCGRNGQCEPRDPPVRTELLADGGRVTVANDGAPPVDGGVDTGVDTGVDVQVDTGVDTGIDTGIDTGVDVQIDTGVDSGVDAGVDTGIDTGIDTGVDVRLDTGVDTGVDSGIDPTLPAPRAIAPLSTSRVTSQRPTLRWVNGAMGNGAVVEFSRTRDFASIVRTERATGTSVRPSSALSAGLWFWRLRGQDSARSVEGTATSPVWWFRVGARSADGDRDTSWGAELDLNGDGYADVAVGSPNAEIGRGRVDVFYGGPSGISSTPSVTLRGAAAGDLFGRSVASAGDVNGDGVADLVVGAPEADPGGRMRAGTASVYLGGSGGLSVTPHRVLEGVGALDQFGHSVASAGDVNGDGFADLVVGASGADPGGRSFAGTASVYLGGSGGPSMTPHRVLEGAVAGDWFGYSVASVRDVNARGTRGAESSNLLADRATPRARAASGLCTS